MLAACGFVLTALVVKERVFPAGSVTSTAESIDASEMQRLMESGIKYGTDTGSVSVLEFSDFQCPYCARFAFSIDSARAELGIGIRFTFRHFPISSIHPHARAAALAAECANAQGKFESFRRTIFEQQALIGVKAWKDFAVAAGVPSIETFERCVEDERFADHLAADLLAAQELGVGGTPTFFINGKRFDRTLSRAELLGELRSATHD